MKFNNIYNIMVIITMGVFITIGTLGCKTKKKGKTVPKKSQKSTEKKAKKGDKAENKSNPITGYNDSYKKPVDKNDADQKGSSESTKLSKKDNKTSKTSKISKSGDKKTPKLSKKELINRKIYEKLTLAKAFMKKKNSSSQKKAIKYAREVLQLKYDVFDAILIISEAQYNLKSYGKMVSALNRIKLLRSKMKPVTKVSGRWHLLMGRYFLHLTRDMEKKGFTIKALVQKERAAKEFSHPSTNGIPEALFVRGSLFLESGDHVKGLEILKKVESMQAPAIKGNWRFYLNLGVALMYNKQYIAAEKKLRYALRALNSDCYLCHFNLALIYSQWKDLPKIGNYSTKDRANLVIKHASAYRSYLKRNRNYDNNLVKKLTTWINIAKSKR